MTNFHKIEQRIQNALSSGAVRLDLSGLRLTTVPEAIASLPNLQWLNLRDNQLTSLPEVIASFTNLQSLDLRRNQLTTLPEAIANLTNLQTLSLFSNQLTNLPEAIANLTNLQTLSLFSNQLTTLPEAIAQLTNLETLYLSNNQLTNLPEAIANLTNLQTLSLFSNQLTTLPEAIANLTNLQSLDLRNNQLTRLPDAIAQLTNLQRLYLGNNQLTTLSDAIAQLTNLQLIDLSGNQLTTLPDGLQQLNQLQTLHLQENADLKIPPELLEPTSGNRKGVENILDYYYRTRQGKKRPLNEAKLILVGFGAVGKTSLVNRLLHNTFDKDSPQTHGIQITQWPMRLNGTEGVRLNIWDFGGQEIMHATHQFFLTQRSLYILVLNGRQGHEDADAEYWLNLIESFGQDSPVIVVLNKIKACPFDLNRGGLRQKFENIADFIETDCEDGHHLDRLRQVIERETDQLKHLRDAFPDSWFAIKDQLATMSQNYITFEQYRSLCADQGEADPKAQESLVYALHRLGIVLNYHQDPRLSDTHVLNPHWVTQGIYTLLTSSTLTKQKGELNLCDIAKLLDPEDYPRDRHPFLVDLMRKFDLCFPFLNKENHYLIPQLLDKQQPPEAEDFEPSKCLNFQYHYPILPEGLLPRFIVRTYTHSTRQPRWRTGVILEFDGARALVKADIQEKRVYIYVTGSLFSQRSLLAIIRANFEHIHGSFSFQTEAMVPVPGHPQVLIPYQDLLLREEKNRPTVEVVLPSKDIIGWPVAELLDGVGRSKIHEARSVNLNLIHNDFRGANIGNLAEHQHGTQQTTQIPSNSASSSLSQFPETP